VVVGTILYWAQVNSALLTGSWWWFVPAGLAVALVGTALSLVNFGSTSSSTPGCGCRHRHQEGTEGAGQGSADAPDQGAGRAGGDRPRHRSPRTAPTCCWTCAT